MNLKELREKYLYPNAQVLTFGKDGKLFDSCHTIIDIQSYIGQSLYSLFPELGSIRLAILSLRRGDREIELPAVESNFFGLHGIFDFRLLAHPMIQDQYVWIVLNQTRMYHILRDIQQERNQLKIWKEDQERNKNYDR